MEVDLQEKDAIRAFKEIERTNRQVGLKPRSGASVASDAHSYEITADGTPVGMFVNLYVNGTWNATTNMNLGDY